MCRVLFPWDCCKYKILSLRPERCESCTENILSLELEAAACYYWHGKPGIQGSTVKVQLSPYQKGTTNAGIGRGEGV